MDRTDCILEGVVNLISRVTWIALSRRWERNPNRPLTLYHSPKSATFPWPRWRLGLGFHVLGSLDVLRAVPETILRRLGMEAVAKNTGAILTRDRFGITFPQQFWFSTAFPQTAVAIPSRSQFDLCHIGCANDQQLTTNDRSTRNLKLETRN